MSKEISLTVQWIDLCRLDPQKVGVVANEMGMLRLFFSRRFHTELPFCRGGLRRSWSLWLLGPGLSHLRRLLTLRRRLVVILRRNGGWGWRRIQNI